jgi:hypothetical protein
MSMTPAQRDAFDFAFIEANFQVKQLPEGEMQAISLLHRNLAADYMSRLPCNDQRTEALKALLATKDCAVRALLPGQP